jgi:hypothetical protein
MYFVALTELATPLEVEAAALAADLGTTAYEERLHLLTGLPSVVLTTADRGEATALLAKLRARKHGALACAASAVIGHEAMIPMRGFTLEPDAVVAGEERLPHDEIVALLRAMHRTSTETRAETKSRQFSAGKALLTGGLAFSKTVTREEKSVAQASEQVLYIFRANGETPWLLRERGTSYAGLGARLAASSTQNFLTTIAYLREKAPTAFYDERLLNPRNAATRLSRSGTASASTLQSSSAGGVDLLAHLIAAWSARVRASAAPKLL